MDAYIQTGLGIFISVILFLFGYRQTIGAKKERIRAANKAVQKALIRRMVLEDYNPRFKDITRILEGKAREFHVGSVDIHSEEQVLTQLFTEVFDNDLITPAQRADIEKRLDDVTNEMIKQKEEVAKPTEQMAPLLKKQKERLVTEMGIITSMLGAVTALVFTIKKTGVTIDATSILDVKLLLPVIAVFVGSLTAIAAIYIFKKSRETPEEPSRRSAMHEDIELEQEIASILEKSGFPFEIEPFTPTGLRPDFIIEMNGKKIAIEAKAWREQPPLHFFAQTRNYAKSLLDSNIADEVLVVTKLRSPISKNIANVTGISVLSVKELSSFLKKKTN